jgi:hypothetical protein
MAAYAPITYRKSEAATLFDIPFDYLSQKFVVVSREDVVQTYGTDYDFLDKSRVRFLKGNVPAGAAITLKRRTDAASRLVSWRDASVMKASDLELSQLQLLHVAEEAAYVAGLALAPDFYLNWNAYGRRITNVGDPVLEQDAVNSRTLRAFVEKAIAGISGGFGWFIQTGLGAIYRTFQEKMRDRISFKDFGAIGDGNYHPLSERYLTLAAAVAAYPSVPIVSLSDSIDWAALWAADRAAAERGITLDASAGTYLLTKTLIRMASWAGAGTETAWGGDLKGTTLKPYGAGNPKRWTDIDGNDLADFTPLVVFGRSDITTSGITHKCDDSSRWSVGTFVPCLKRIRFMDVDCLGPWTKAGHYVDATWSNTNPTLTALHPTIQSDSGNNEHSYVDCYFEGMVGFQTEGTTRPATTVPWVYSPSGTSDHSYIGCRFGSSGPYEDRKVRGSGYRHSAKRSSDTGGQGLHFVNCSSRVSAKYTFNFDYSGRVTFSGQYNETVDSYAANNDVAVFAVTSNTGAVHRCGDEQRGGTTLDGVAVASSSAPDWRGTRRVTTMRADGMMSGPNYHFPGTVGTAAPVDFYSFNRTSGDFRFWYDDGADPLLYLTVARAGLVPAITTPAMDLGKDTNQFRTAYVQNVRVSMGFRPTTGNTVTCAIAGAAWAGGFTQTAFTVTSDETLKTFTDHIDDALLDAWAKVDWRSWKFNDRIEVKGDAARVHFGTGAQTVEQVLREAGLNPFDYALLCFDEWPDEVDPDTGELVREGGSKYGLRYEEALCLEAALQRRTTVRLEARLKALEEINV